MKLLAFDTATEACSVAVLVDGECHGEYRELSRGHAEVLLPMIDALLERTGLTLDALDAIAFGRGPGAFTGVRLAASCAQGLAFGAGLPVVPVSDLAAVALRVLRESPQAPGVLVCSDARMGQVYAGAFERGADGDPRPIGPERVLDPAAVAGTLAPGPGWHGAGSGFRAYPALGAALGPALAAVHAGVLPRAEEIARLAARAVERGEALPAEQALPVYIRDNVARPQP